MSRCSHIAIALLALFPFAALAGEPAIDARNYPGPAWSPSSRAEQPSPIASPGKLIGGVIFGLMFGFLLQKGGVGKYHILVGQLLLQDRTVAMKAPGNGPRSIRKGTSRAWMASRRPERCASPTGRWTLIRSPGLRLKSWILVGFGSAGANCRLGCWGAHEHGTHGG